MTSANENAFFIKLNRASEVFDRKADIERALKDVGFCLIRGACDSHRIVETLARLSEEFDARNDIRRSGPIRFEMPNFQRLDCGDYSQVNARFSRLITRFFWRDAEAFSEEFQVMQRVRDSVLGRHIAYDRGTYRAGEKRFYEFPKILQYPRGGGFLNEHYDGYNFDGVFNIGLSVTQRGVHFKSGGVFYRFRDGTECDAESYLEPGDLYFHDADAAHGVHAVDGNEALDLSSLSGRISLILSSESFVD